MVNIKINDLPELEKKLLLKYTVGGGLPTCGWSSSVYIREFPTIHPNDLRKSLLSLVDYGYLSYKGNDTDSFFFTDDGIFEANNYFKDEVTSSRMPNTATNPTTNKSNNPYDWHNKPIGLICISVIIAILSALVIYIIKHYTGLPL